MLSAIKRTALAAFITGALLSPAASALAQSGATPTYPGPTVVDSKGKEVGPFDVDQQTVLILFNGSPALFSVDKTGFINGGALLFYTTTNCTGTAYVFPTDPATANSLRVDYSQYSANGWGVIGGVLYYPAPGTPKTVAAKSERGIDPSGNIVCNQYSSPSAPYSSPQTFKLSTLGFVPPFKVVW
jgi:hypothetical protein